MERLVVILFVAILVLKTEALAEEFLISHWCGPSEADPEKIAQAAEAGFNVVAFGGTVEQNKKALDMCLQHGIKALLIDERLINLRPRQRSYTELLGKVLEDYGSHPAVWGYFVKDEPSASEFRGLAAVNRYISSKDPQRVVFYNLLPTYASREQLGRAVYEQYVDEFCRTVHPKLISFDHYALLSTGERADYFENLEIIRRQSIKHSIPFVYTLLSVQHGLYRDPSEEDLRWQINTALAYGAHGIMYFTYETPRDPSLNYGEAIIGRDGKPTTKYKQVQQINAEVMKLAPTLLRLKSVAVYHTGEIPHGTKSLPEGGLISRIVGGDFVVGQFDSDSGQKYAMFVNKNPRQSTRATVVFSQKVRLWEVSRLTGKLRASAVCDDGPGSRWTATFAPGEGKLMLIDTPQNLPILYWNDTPKFRPRVMLNPSCQFGNVIRGPDGEELYNEGRTMFDIAVKVKEELVRDGRVDVFISRESREQSVSLHYETELTKSLNCDALVSLHSDATGDGTPGGGTWTFYADEGEGKRLAECVQMHLLEAIRSFYPEVQFRGIRTHWYRLWVLWESGCPASLTEILFHTNPREREMLKDPKLQEIMARAIARGILDYFRLP
ncbi:MAG: N-acetylmuramoyl-L-alanine amidase [Armatimonadota bacterium]|nr:N-acetylmuramoyl-L-alanine amidase [Armatimonadota bacterium]